MGRAGLALRVGSSPLSAFYGLCIFGQVTSPLSREFLHLENGRMNSICLEGFGWSMGEGPRRARK